MKSALASTQISASNLHRFRFASSQNIILMNRSVTAQLRPHFASQFFLRRSVFFAQQQNACRVKGIFMRRRANRGQLIINKGLRFRLSA